MLLQRSKHMKSDVATSAIQAGWPRRSQQNDCSSWCRNCTVLLRIAPRDTSGSPLAHSLTQSSQCMCAVAVVPRCVDNSFSHKLVQMPNFPSRLTHFEFFGSRRICAFPLYCILFCLRIEMVHQRLIACQCRFQERISLLLKNLEESKEQSRNVDFWALPSDILVPTVHTLCGVPVLHGQCCAQLRRTTSMQRIICYWNSPVSQNHFLSSRCVHFRSWRTGPTGAMIIMDVPPTILNPAPYSDMLQTHCAITSYLRQLALNFDGRTIFRPQNRITLRTYSPDHVSSDVTIAYQPRIYPISIWLTHSCAFCCMLLLQNATTCRKTKCLIETNVTR
jgi:hypothetical protein